MSTEYERPETRASRTGLGLTLAAGTVALAATLHRPAAAAVVLAGLTLTGLAVHRGSRRLHAAGTLVGFGGAVLAGVATGSAGVERALVAAAAVLLAWDVGENAIGLGRQLGRGARTAEIELAHAAASALLATGVGVAAVVVYRAARGGVTLATAVALIVAAIALTVAIDR